MENEREYKLTPRERKFCEAYVRLGKKEAAAIEAGYSPTSAAAQASRMLKKDNILAYTRTIQKHAREELGIDDNWAVLQAVEIYNRCMLTEPVMKWDYEQHKMVESGEYTFNAKGAIGALNLIKELLGLGDGDTDKLKGAITIINNIKDGD